MSEAEFVAEMVRKAEEWICSATGEAACNDCVIEAQCNGMAHCEEIAHIWRCWQEARGERS